MKQKEFIERLNLALNSKTKYKKGGWGSHSGNLWYFDCVCLIKGILWGWKGDLNQKHGGAIYKSNNVPDYGDTKFFNLCNNISTNFNNIHVGEMVWMKGHVGVYVGNGEVIEATGAWDRCVLKSKIGTKGERTYKGKQVYSWLKHGFIPYVEYVSRETFNLDRVLKKGCKGADVRELQKQLINKGYNCGKWGIDGSFGNDTVKAVKKFQKAHKLTQDGIVGPATAHKLGWTFKGK